jgi:hypothetical protein
MAARAVLFRPELAKTASVSAPDAAHRWTSLGQVVAPHCSITHHAVVVMADFERISILGRVSLERAA